MSIAQPSFSIIIPTHGRRKQLATCLESLTQLEYPRDRFNIIVVDDGTIPPVEPSIREFKDRLNLLVLRQQQAGPASARNSGAAHATGEYLAFTDDDCAPVPDWLHALAEQFREHPDSLIGGLTMNDLPNNIFTTASQMLISYLYDYYNAESRNARFIASNNMSLSKKMFDEIGGFDVHFQRAAAEDREFCDRWLHRGHRIVYTPRAIVRHRHVLTLWKFLRQHFTYGRGAFYFHQNRSRRRQDRMRVEPLTFYFNLVRYPLRTSSWPSGLCLSVLMALSQVANIAGYFCERIRNLGR